MAGRISNDGWGEVANFRDEFMVDSKAPRVEVEIEELEESK